MEFAGPVLALGFVESAAAGAVGAGKFAGRRRAASDAGREAGSMEEDGSPCARSAPVGPLRQGGLAVRSLPATWVRLAALVLILAAAERGVGQSFGFMSMPSSFAQYLGYGYGPGRHAPLVAVPGRHPQRTPRKAYMSEYLEPAPYDTIGCGGWGADCGCAQGMAPAPAPVVQDYGPPTMQQPIVQPPMAGPQLGSPQAGSPLISSAPDGALLPSPAAGPTMLRSPAEPAFPGTVFPTPPATPQVRPLPPPVPRAVAPPAIRRSNALPPEKMPAPDDRQAWQFMGRR